MLKFVPDDIPEMFSFLSRPAHFGPSVCSVYQRINRNNRLHPHTHTKLGDNG